MSELRIEPLDATLGAVITGVDLATLDDHRWADVEDAFHTHAVLVFPGQHLGDDAQIGFGRRFGEIEVLREGRNIVPIANSRKDGTVLAPDHPAIDTLRGNEGWHTDSSYMPLAAKASVLAAHIVPSAGGQTEWADMRAAYDALDEPTRDRITGLSAYHSLRHSQARIGDTLDRSGQYGYFDGPAPLRPLVKVHPVTGRPALFIGRHAYGIPGLDPAESERLLDDLLEAACQPPRTYAHDWKPGDVVVWDNRCVLHRVRPWDLSEARLMRHVRVAGDPATELAAA